eukprot:CAMPEP_0204191582 /NCGR_PEP_ID=MMETSP0361-20130328/60199_1 /ASSEMBLY_ACC=CAM_ASM_000343 /TAXON_ID=268821 /ORGANISM="Scrippsiella Hangoei, Strain SHTV-5" /LENGTH=43 /DNA_ID= /DNA_START= /DNA_END= /DNA_ORIENTATION=
MRTSGATPVASFRALGRTMAQDELCAGPSATGRGFESVSGARE